MEQEQILSTLKEKLGPTSLSDRTLSDFITGNMPEEGKEFNYEKHVNFLKSLNGNYSHDVAAKVVELEKKYNSQPKEDAMDKKDAPEPSEIQKLLSRIEALEKANTASAKEGRKASVRSQVQALSDSLKVHNKNLWKDCVNEIAISDEDTQETVLEKAKKSYEKKLRDYFGEGASPYGGKSAEQSQSEKKAHIDKRNALKARLKAQGKL